MCRGELVSLLYRLNASSSSPSAPLSPPSMATSRTAIIIITLMPESDQLTNLPELTVRIERLQLLLIRPWTVIAQPDLDRGH